MCILYHVCPSMCQHRGTVHALLCFHMKIAACHTCPVLVCCRGSGRDVAADERCAAGHSLMAAPVEDTLRLAYPDIYDISLPDGNWGTEQGGKVTGFSEGTGWVRVYQEGLGQGIQGGPAQALVLWGNGRGEGLGQRSRGLSLIHISQGIVR